MNRTRTDGEKKPPSHSLSNFESVILFSRFAFVRRISRDPSLAAVYLICGILYDRSSWRATSNGPVVYIIEAHGSRKQYEASAARRSKRPTSQLHLSVPSPIVPVKISRVHLQGTRGP